MRLIFTALLLSLLALPALTGGVQAACYADYKAKRDDPLRFSYGVAQVSEAGCGKKAARAELEPRLSAAGWTLLKILSTFGPEGLDERKASAGDYFLRY